MGLEKLHPFDAGKWGKVIHFLKGERGIQCVDVVYDMQSEGVMCICWEKGEKDSCSFLCVVEFYLRLLEELKSKKGTHLFEQKHGNTVIIYWCKL